MSPPADENVQFTVYRPRCVAAHRWYTLLAFAHLVAKRRDAPAHEPHPVEEVARQAVRVLGEREVRNFQSVVQDAPQPVRREETLTFVPDVPGLEFNPPHRHFRWTESVHREEFRFRAEPELVGRVARGRLSVFLGDVLLADVTLAISVKSPDEMSEDAEAPQTETARRYRKIFASYSHKDLPIVEQIERLTSALGDDYVRDWKHLRSGEVWDERLLRMIEEADVFQLFWSHESMNSAFVRQEFEHALSLNRPNFVRPTYWEDPLPSDPSRDLPPEPLRRIHFQRIGPVFSANATELSSPDSPTSVGRKPLVEVPGYEIQEMLRAGGLGHVHLARHQKLDRLVVLKIEPHRSGLQLKREPAFRLSHPNIVPILDIIRTPEHTCTVTLYYSGGSLADRLREGRLPPLQAASLVMFLASATDYAHRAWARHFDLKPSHVLFDHSGRPALIGFYQLVLEEGLVYGTPAYMAPEQATGRTALLGPATDVYGLGAVLYECLTGRPPFQGATAMEVLKSVTSEEPARPRTLNPEIPEFLESICLRCLQKRVEDRYSTCDQLADALRRGLSHPGQHSSSPDISASVIRSRHIDDDPRLRRSSTGPLALGCVLVILCAIAVIGWIVSHFSQQ